MPVTQGTRLGAFRLDDLVARGGMGAVWRATHIEQGLRVALKVMSVDAAAEPTFAGRFREEVRAVAALDHPGIATVLDHGEVEARAADESGGELVQGSPWFAMELCPGGTLSKWPKGRFVDLKLAWTRILDALAHAHARGVVHRDLKPGNVLLAGDPLTLPPVKLVDFGIALARLDPDRTGPIDEQIVGTPQYMAPEQLQGLWRDYGPWTDLYAFGCVAWAQLTGATPFYGRSAVDALVGALTKPLPRLAPRVPVPAELEGWLRGLLEKDPARRFQRAADAACALAAIGDAIEIAPANVVADWDETRIVAAAKPIPTTITPPPSGERPKAAPIPPTWRRDEPLPPPLPMVGAGLRLFGLRRVPLVGREKQRDELWARLCDVSRTGRARVVVVRGAAGAGKSALVQWLCERSHENGAAQWVKATFAPGLSQGEPLQRLAAAWLNVKGLPRSEVRARVARWFEDHGSTDVTEIEVVTELICPATPADIAAGERPVRLTRMREYYAGTRNTMARAAATERPLIVWLDDVQWGIHGIGLATQILRTQDEQPFPTLVVLTVRDEALIPGSVEDDRLRKLLALPDAEELRLGPLPREVQRELVGRMLSLAPALAAQVVERTAGNPLFAVQIVAGMVQRGALRLREHGLELVPGASPDLPADVSAVWRQRLERLLSEFPPQTRDYLELAAVLGTPVDRKEWRRACDDPDGLFGDRFLGEEPLRAQLVDRLIEERLAVRVPQGWAFVHGMLEEALVDAAKRGKRLQGHHQAAAAVLQRKADDPSVAERLGQHLLAAGRPADAVAPLIRGIEVRWVTTGAISALALLQRAEEASALLPQADPRRGRLHVLTAALHLEQGEVEAARTSAAAALAGGERWKWPVWRAHEVIGAIALREGRIPDAEAAWGGLLLSADEKARAHGEKGMAQLARRRNDHAQAATRFRSAAVLFRGAGDPVEAAACEVLRGRMLVLLGDRAAARESLEAAHGALADHGAATGVAEALDALARLERAEGRNDVAEARLRDAMARYEALGAAVQAHLARLRLAVWLAQDRRLSEIQGLVERAARLAGLEGTARDVVHDAARWALAGLRGDLAAWDEAFQAVSAGIVRLASPKTALAAETVAWLGWTAAALLPVAEQQRSDEAYAGVAVVFQVLGRADLLEELRVARRM